MRMMFSVAAAVMVLGQLGGSFAQAVSPESVTVLMDSMADPCEDFFQYTCGSWIKSNPLPEGRQIFYYVADSTIARSNAVIKQIIHERWPLVGELWDSCMDTEQLNVLGNTPLQKGLQKIQAVDSTEELILVAGELGRTGLTYLSSVQVSADEMNGSTNAVHLSIPSLTLDLSYYDPGTFNRVEENFRTYISSILHLSGYLPSSKSSNYSAEDVIDIQFMLASLSNAANSDDAEQYNSITLSDAVSRYSVRQLAKGLEILKPLQTADDSTIIFSSLDYFDTIEKVLNSKDLDDLKLYLAYLSLRGFDGNVCEWRILPGLF